jgi:hypothetical protein
MTLIIADRVIETSTTTGTGAITLAGALTGFRTWASQCAVADTAYYLIEAVDANGLATGEWEAGLGTYSAANTLTRTTVISSSNANAAVTFSAGTKRVSLSPTAAFLAGVPFNTYTQTGIVSEPAAPAAGTLTYYSKQIAGRMVAKLKGPSGLDYPLQASFWQNNITMWNPTTATAGVWLGTAGAGSGTFSAGLPTATNIYTSTKRGRWANVVTTTNQVLGQRNTEAMFTRGSVAGQGGFYFFARCGMDTWTNGGRFFAGLSNSMTNVVSSDPSVQTNTCGFMVDAADNGLIYFGTHSAGAVTKVSTGFTIASNSGYDMYIFAKPNGTDIGWRIVDINSGSEASGTATTNLPANNSLMSVGVMAGNAALTTVTAINLGVNRIYVETDY